MNKRTVIAFLVIAGSVLLIALFWRTFVVLAFFAFIIAFVYAGLKKQAERAEKIANNAICPGCGERGQLSTSSQTTKEGISGGKATAAILTGGASLWLVGLSKMVGSIRAECRNCGTVQAL